MIGPIFALGAGCSRTRAERRGQGVEPGIDRRRIAINSLAGLPRLAAPSVLETRSAR